MIKRQSLIRFYLKVYLSVNELGHFCDVEKTMTKWYTNIIIWRQIFIWSTFEGRLGFVGVYTLYSLLLLASLITVVTFVFAYLFSYFEVFQIYCKFFSLLSNMTISYPNAHCSILITSKYWSRWSGYRRK